MTRYTVDIEAVPEEYVLVHRRRGPIRNLGGRLERLEETLAVAGMQAVGPPLARFYQMEFDPADTDYDVCLPIAADDTGAAPDQIGDFPVEVIPAHHAMVTLHRGSLKRIEAAHRAVREALDAVGYTLSGPACEVYVRGPWLVGAPDDLETVLRYPYAR